MYIEGMMGLGDNVYQRAFISAIKFPVYIETPWPELYEGTLARPVLPLTHLRTQMKNIKRQTRWHDPLDAQTITQRSLMLWWLKKVIRSRPSVLVSKVLAAHHPEQTSQTLMQLDEQHLKPGMPRILLKARCQVLTGQTK